MKRYVTYPDWVEKFRSPGRSKKQNINVLLNIGKCIQTYLGKTAFDILFLSLSFLNILKFGLSHFIISSFKRDLIRSSFRATDDTVYLGVVQYIFGSCQDIFLTYKNKNLYAK